MYDLGIIGGGPAGYTAAERAAAQDLKVILFEEKKIGGVCLNEGCIPTKALLQSAHVIETIHHADKYGISVNAEPTFNLEQIIQRKNHIVHKMQAGVRAKLRHNFITVIEGHAAIKGRQGELLNVSCNDEIHEVKNLLIATGSREFMPSIPGIESASVVTHRDLLNLTTPINELVIIGGGYIGIEFADYFSSLNTKVTIVELKDTILEGTDRELTDILRVEYEKRGITFYLNAQVTQIEGNEVIFTQDKEIKRVSGDKILVSVGRVPNLEGFGLEVLDIEAYRKGIRVNNQMQTSEPNVYAAGDVTGFSKLAHAAYREADVVVNTIKGIYDPMNFQSIPGCIFSNPEIATVGLTEEALKMAWMPHRIVKIPMTYSGRFEIENGGFAGLCKLILGDSDEILGVHIIGNMATEIIVSATMAINNRFSAKQWAKNIFPHPSVSEIFREALYKA
ncbi:dihydrolipoyl dehydrogenase [Microbacter margulisiae]|uniref:Dihydrolipoyl dehydrogenase n=1 Tax=Microbacter margulisiae TaxID=1350067 RepID=A0A7W5DQD5_9PORP|nr:dihydrolipoyl dehydrogenase [Microbacter margulisiae]MBB3186855.1 dihydrolipoamide dehydrogenase [Microbacter margulisiae]